jgi:hypothetical protein
MTTSRSTGSTPTGQDDANGSSGELLRALTDDVRALVRQEVRAAQNELTGKAQRAGKGAAMLGGAAVLGALAIGSSAAVLTRVLEKVFPRTTAALLATALYGAGAAALAGAGIEELRRTLPLAPERAVSGLREDVQAATAVAADTRGDAGD